MSCVRTVASSLALLFVLGGICGCGDEARQLSDDEERAQLATAIQVLPVFPVPEAASQCVADQIQPKLHQDSVRQLLLLGGSLRDVEIAGDRSLIIQAYDQCVRFSEMMRQFAKAMSALSASPDVELVEAEMFAASGAALESCVASELQSRLVGVGEAYQLLTRDHDVPADPDKVVSTYLDAIEYCLQQTA